MGSYPHESCSRKKCCERVKPANRLTRQILVDGEVFELCGTPAQRNFQERAAKLLAIQNRELSAGSDISVRTSRRLGSESTPTPVTAVTPWILVPLTLVLYA